MSNPHPIGFEKEARFHKVFGQACDVAEHFKARVLKKIRSCLAVLVDCGRE